MVTRASIGRGSRHENFYRPPPKFLVVLNVFALSEIKIHEPEKRAVETRGSNEAVSAGKYSATLRRERNCDGSTSRSRTAGIAPAAIGNVRFTSTPVFGRYA
jgi:hypothetical protein